MGEWWRRGQRHRCHRAWGWLKAQDGKPASITSKLTPKPSFVACGHFQAAAWKCWSLGSCGCFSHPFSCEGETSQWEPIDQHRGIGRPFLWKEGCRELGALTQIRMSSLKHFHRLTSWVWASKLPGLGKPIREEADGPLKIKHRKNLNSKLLCLLQNLGRMWWLCQLCCCCQAAVPGWRVCFLYGVIGLIKLSWQKSSAVGNFKGWENNCLKCYKGLGIGFMPFVEFILLNHCSDSSFVSVRGYH